MKSLVVAAIGLSAILALGCGKPKSSGGSGSGGSDTEESNSSKSPVNSLAIQSSADLPTCNADSEGHLVYVKDDGSFQTCSSGSWVVIDISGPKGDKGDPGSEGSKGDQGPTGPAGNTDPESLVNTALDLHEDYRLSIYRLSVTCNSCSSGAPSRTQFGSGFLCDSNVVCTNRHVIECPAECSLGQVQMQAVDATLDTVNPTETTQSAPFYSSTTPAITTHATKDLAKIVVSGVPAAANEVLLASAQFDKTRLLRPTLSMSFPLAFQDMYTDIGEVINNTISECNGNSGYGCPGPQYDYATSNDTDHGSSGSPIFDILDGTVIGITSAGTEGANANYTWVIDAFFLSEF